MALNTKKYRKKIMTESIVMLQTRKFTEGFSVIQGTEDECILDVRENTARSLFAKGYARKATDGEINHAKIARAAYAGTNINYGG